MIDLYSHSQFPPPNASLSIISLETIENEGGGPHSLADTDSFQKIRLNSFITDSPAKELARPTSQPGEHRPGCLLTTEWNCRAGASSAGPFLGQKENQINLEQPWPRISRERGASPLAPAVGGWGAPRPWKAVSVPLNMPQKKPLPQPATGFGARMGRARGRGHLFSNPHSGGREPGSNGK